MRKALIGMILAATTMTPVAAWAQDDDGGRAERIQQRIQQRQEARNQRQETRSVRQDARTERRAERPVVRQERSQSSVQQVQVSPGTRAFNRRGERNLQRAAEAGMISGGQARQEHREDRRDWRRDRRDDRQDWRQDRRENRQDRVRDGRQDRQDWRQDRRDDRRDWRQDRRDDRRDWRQDRRGDRGDWRNRWDRNSWRNDRRYDWQSWRYRNRSLFRSPYYSPFRNHRYSRFSIGLFLEPIFFSQRYWLSDPWQYRLPYAPPGTRWVRYYNDVLLVDTYSGEIIDVIYDFFW